MLGLRSRARRRLAPDGDQLHALRDGHRQQCSLRLGVDLDVQPVRLVRVLDPREVAASEGDALEGCKRYLRLAETDARERAVAQRAVPQPEPRDTVSLEPALLEQAVRENHVLEGGISERYIHEVAVADLQPNQVEVAKILTFDHASVRIDLPHVPVLHPQPVELVGVTLDEGLQHELFGRCGRFVCSCVHPHIRFLGNGTIESPMSVGGIPEDIDDPGLRNGGIY